MLIVARLLAFNAHEDGKATQEERVAGEQSEDPLSHKVILSPGAQAVSLGTIGPQVPETLQPACEGPG